MRMPELQEGAAAPPIHLLTDSGDTFDLNSLRGKNVVLFFYPKADTPGCTIEAKEFRDAKEKFASVRKNAFVDEPSSVLRPDS